MTLRILKKDDKPHQVVKAEFDDERILLYFLSPEQNAFYLPFRRRDNTSVAPANARVVQMVIQGAAKLLEK